MTPQCHARLPPVSGPQALVIHFTCSERWLLYLGGTPGVLQVECYAHNMVRPKRSPKCGTTTSPAVVECDTKFARRNCVFGGGSQKSLVCRESVGAITSLSVGCWLRLWPGGLLGQAGIFTCHCC